MHPKDDAAHGLYMLNSLRAAQGRKPREAHEFEAAEIADGIASLLRLAVQLDYYPEAVAQDGVDYCLYDSDDADEPAPDVVALHGSPAELEPGTVLKPGPHLHHVYASADISDARMWGSVKAAGKPVHIYRVRMSADARLCDNGFLASSATVLYRMTALTKKKNERGLTTVK